MSNAAMRIVKQPAIMTEEPPAKAGLPAQTLQAAEVVEGFLGPAEVVDVVGGNLNVLMPSGAVVTAAMALAYPYEPAVGDVLLVIGKADAHYVIGVLRGAGKAVLSFQGNVALRAVGGSLSLSGDEGVDVSGPELKVNTGKLEMVANAAVQTFVSLRQRVSSLLSIHAGQSHTVVDGDSHSQSNTSTKITNETMTFQGKTIHMF